MNPHKEGSPCTGTASWGLTFPDFKEQIPDFLGSTL
jgi:hypothetical protein